MRTILCFLFLLVFCVGYQLFFSVHDGIESFHLLAEKQLSSVAGHAVKNAYVECKKMNMSDARALLYLKQKFPFIKELSFAYCPSGNSIKLTLYTSLCCVNDNLLLTENTQLIDRSFFTDAACSDLRTMTVSQEGLSNPEHIIQAFYAISSLVGYDYTIDFKNKYAVHVSEKNDPYFSIVYSSEQQIAPVMLDYCEKIKKDIVVHNEHHKKRAWVADMRFNNYIVAYGA